MYFYLMGKFLNYLNSLKFVFLNGYIYLPTCIYTYRYNSACNFPNDNLTLRPKPYCLAAMVSYYIQQIIAISVYVLTMKRYNNFSFFVFKDITWPKIIGMPVEDFWCPCCCFRCLPALKERRHCLPASPVY